MNETVLDMGEREQLLELLQAQGVAVVIWNPTKDTVCNTSQTLPEELKQSLFKDKRETKQAGVERELVKMGFRPGQTGFYNIVESILLITEVERGRPIRVTSEIYPRVAQINRTTVCNVERTIRNSIESVWKRSNLRTLQTLYPYPCDNLSGRPTNAEFLINMAGKFRD